MISAVVTRPSLPPAARSGPGWHDGYESDDRGEPEKSDEIQFAN